MGSRRLSDPVGVLGRKNSKSSGCLFKFLKTPFEIVLSSSHVNNVVAQLPDHPLVPTAQQSDLAFDNIEMRSLFALLTFDRIKAPTVILLFSNNVIEPRNHNLPHRGGIAEPSLNLGIKGLNSCIERLNLVIESFEQVKHVSTHGMEQRVSG